MHIVEIFLYRSSFNRLGIFGSDSREIEYYNEYSKYSEVSVIDYEKSNLNVKFEIISKPKNVEILNGLDYNNVVTNKLKKEVNVLEQNNYLEVGWV